MHNRFAARRISDVTGRVDAPRNYSIQLTKTLADKFGLARETPACLAKPALLSKVVFRSQKSVGASRSYGAAFKSYSSLSKSSAAALKSRSCLSKLPEPPPKLPFPIQKSHRRSQKFRGRFQKSPGASRSGVPLSWPQGTARAIRSNGVLGIPAAFERIVRYIVVTPDLHRIHHSELQEETNSHFGAVFPIWDLVFGTFRAAPRDGHESMRLGLDEARGKDGHRPLWLLGSQLRAIP